MKRKTLALLLATCLCMNILTACGGGSTNTNVNSDASTTSDLDTKVDGTKSETKDSQKTETKTETTTKKGRPYGDQSVVTKSPTCTEDGIRTFYGKDGEYTKPEPATGHKWYDVYDDDGNVIDRRCEYCATSDPDWSSEETEQSE